MSNHSHRRESSVGDEILSLSTEIVDFAFMDFTVDPWHPLSPVQPTTIEVACRTRVNIVFDTMLLAVLLAFTVGPQFENLFLNFIGPLQQLR